jgi:hypothetical protein
MKGWVNGYISSWLCNVEIYPIPFQVCSRGFPCHPWYNLKTKFENVRDGFIISMETWTKRYPTYIFNLRLLNWFWAIYRISYGWNHNRKQKSCSNFNFWKWNMLMRDYLASVRRQIKIFFKRGWCHELQADKTETFTQENCDSKMVCIFKTLIPVQITEVSVKNTITPATSRGITEQLLSVMMMITYL